MQAGDTLGAIAAAHGATVDTIVALNRLNESALLRVGQELIVPGPPLALGPATPTPTPLPTEAVRYVVQPGDTLLSIAADYGASMQVLMTVNEIEDPALLRAGQEMIIIPGTATPEPTDTALPPPTATPGPPFPAPALLWPTDGFALPAGSPATLNWNAVGLLADDEWYLVRVTPQEPPGAPTLEALVKETSWHLPDDLIPQDGQPRQRFRWQVLVVRTAGLTPGSITAQSGPPSYEVISASGASRVFAWGG
ncbi:MAG: LysM peptidoglycan-binding domain-containing protein [Chloroflexi bacterium]|nr:LysM peptidoglycan-binding domain-containing protein [Chloroflexota bacterium]